MPSRRCRSAQQRQDLRLDRDVERGGRLVGDQQVGLVGERHGDHHALALAAGELVRIGVEALLGLLQPDQVQQLERAPPRRRPADAAVHDQRLADLPLDGVQRVQRGHRLLEDHARCDRRAPRAASPRRRRSAPARRSGCCRRDGRRADRAAAAGSRARSPTCPSRSRRPARAVSPARSLNDTLAHRLERAALDRSWPTGPRPRASSSARRHHQRNVLRGSKASRTASPMKTSSVSMSARTAKPVKPSHGACRLFLPCCQQLAERRRAGRQAEAEEVERGQRGDDAAE